MSAKRRRATRRRHASATKLLLEILEDRTLPSIAITVLSSWYPVSTPSPSYGQEITFTATVSNSDGSPVTTGNVQFTGPVSGSVTTEGAFDGAPGVPLDSTGTAILKTGFADPQAGIDTIGANYYPPGATAPTAEAQPLTLTVLPNVSLTSSPDPAGLDSSGNPQSVTLTARVSAVDAAHRTPGGSASFMENITGSLMSGQLLVTGLSSTAGLSDNEPVTGLGIAPGTFIESFTQSPPSLTLSQAPTQSSGTSYQGLLTQGSPYVQDLPSTDGLFVGQPVSDNNNSLGTIAAIDSSPASDVLGTLTAGSALFTGLSSTAGLFVGEYAVPTHPGDFAVGTIVNMINATTSSSGSWDSNSKSITGIVSSVMAGLYVNEPVSGTGIPNGTTIASIDSAGSSITLNQITTASGSTATFTALSVTLSNPAQVSTSAEPVAFNPSESLRGVLTNNTNAVHGLASTAGLYPGEPVSAPGFSVNPPLAIASGPSAITSSMTTVSCSWVGGTNTVSVPAGTDLTGVYVRDSVTGSPDILPGTTVTSVGTTTITLSQKTTTSGSGSLTFTDLAVQLNSTCTGPTGTQYVTFTSLAITLSQPDPYSSSPVPQNLTFSESNLGVVLGTSTLSNGRATLVTSALGQGTYTITAQYNPDSDTFATSTSAIPDVQIVDNLSAPTINVTSSTPSSGDYAPRQPHLPRRSRGRLAATPPPARLRFSFLRRHRSGSSPRRTPT